MLTFLEETNAKKQTVEETNAKKQKVRLLLHEFWYVSCGTDIHAHAKIIFKIILQQSQLSSQTMFFWVGKS